MNEGDNMTDNMALQTNNNTRGKILLFTLPFWSPIIPTQGIAALKGFLQKYGYEVTTVDGTSENRFMELYNKYFDTIKEIVPEERWGNLFNLGNDVIRDHLAAQSSYTDEADYYELVRLLVHQTYFTTPDDQQIDKLNAIMEQFFKSIEEFVVTLIEEEKPDVLGLSVTSDNLPASKFVFKLTRERYPRIKTVMGGNVFYNHLAFGNPDLDIFLEETESYLDKVIVGKGEVLFLKYLKGELPQSKRVVTLKDLAEGELASYTMELPDMTDYELNRYLYLAAGASSSCIYNCSFCNSRSFFGEFKKKDPIKVVNEIATLNQRYGHKMYFMTDSLLNPVITNLSNEIVKRELVVYMDGYFAVDDMSQVIDNAMLWRQGGFYRARVGTESGSQKILDMMGKVITPEQTAASISTLAQAGIKTTTYWVIGHPGETEEDFQLTLDLIERLKNDIWQAECNPFRYYYVGQASADAWSEIRKPLFPPRLDNMLLTRTWYLEGTPSREEIYDRVYRFTEHCSKLGIPNPYSLSELYKADERWSRLHRNAVPPILEIMKDNVDFSERKNIKKFISLNTQNVEDDGDFDF
jgi:radical SAM superfamily enzyme YgiQ (UPF0313 family)